MLKVILNYHQKAQSALNVGIDLSEITNLAVLQRIARMKEIPIEKSVPELKRLVGKINDAFDSLIANWETENA
jgi:antitoxin component of RelBE/YafQ-DinJ toxin-antitoxin module